MTIKGDVPVTEVQKKLLALDTSYFMFYPTGSRVLGNPTDESDYDFFVADSPEVREWLGLSDFQSITSRVYKDPNTAVVYRWVCPLGQIDVQLQTNIEAKIFIQGCLESTMILAYLGKQEQAMVWRTMYELYEKLNKS